MKSSDRIIDVAYMAEWFFRW